MTAAGCTGIDASSLAPVDTRRRFAHPATGERTELLSLVNPLISGLTASYSQGMFSTSPHTAGRSAFDTVVDAATRDADHSDTLVPRGALRRVDHLGHLAAVVRACPGLHVRYSSGPADDESRHSIDTESGLELPGLSVNPLDAEDWWTRPLEDWLARQLSQYRHLAEQDSDRIAWILRGELCGRGPDCEPLLRDVEPVAVLSEQLLEEARNRYEREFDAGRGPTDEGETS